MSNIWSENKYVNLTINVLLFLMATNFLHYGYLLLPIVCLIIFIDNKYKFKVNNVNVFIILCLFGVTFLVFSYKLGFYCLFGMFLPMAYFIGSNVKDKNEEKVKNIIYILTFGMSVHVLLNFGCDLVLRGAEMFTRNSHLDIWTLDDYSTTQTATNYVFIIGIMYYIFIYENSKKIKYIYLFLYSMLMIYNLALGRRTPILLSVISIIISIIFDLMFNKNKDKKIKSFIIIVVSLFIIIFGYGLYYFFNIYNPWEWRSELSIFHKLFFFGLDSNRLNILLDAIKIAPQHLWGGQEISTLFDINVHDLWMDTYDYAGIIPFLLLVIYSIYCLIKFISIINNKKLSNSFKLLIFVLFVCITIQMFLEPIITGSPILLMCSIITLASIESLNTK